MVSSDLTSEVPRGAASGRLGTSNMQQALGQHDQGMVEKSLRDWISRLGARTEINQPVLESRWQVGAAGFVSRVNSVRGRLQ